MVSLPDISSLISPPRPSALSTSVAPLSPELAGLGPPSGGDNGPGSFSAYLDQLGEAQRARTAASSGTSHSQPGYFAAGPEQYQHAFTAPDFGSGSQAHSVPESADAIPVGALDNTDAKVPRKPGSDSQGRMPGSQADSKSKHGSEQTKGASGQDGDLVTTAATPSEKPGSAELTEGFTAVRPEGRPEKAAVDRQAGESGVKRGEQFSPGSAPEKSAGRDAVGSSAAEQDLRSPGKLAVDGVAAAENAERSAEVARKANGALTGADAESAAAQKPAPEFTGAGAGLGLQSESTAGSDKHGTGAITESAESRVDSAAPGRRGGGDSGTTGAGGDQGSGGERSDSRDRSAALTARDARGIQPSSRGEAGRGIGGTGATRQTGNSPDSVAATNPSGSQGLGIDRGGLAGMPITAVRGTFGEASGSRVNLSAGLREFISSEGMQGNLQSAIVNLRKDGTANVRMMMEPAELGRLRIDLRLQDNRIVGRILVDNGTVRDLMLDQLAELERSLAEQGFDAVEVEVASRDDQKQPGRDADSGLQPKRSKESGAFEQGSAGVETGDGDHLVNITV